MENINNEQKTFHNRKINEIVSDFNTSIKTGLSISQIQENRDKYGSNAIELSKPKK
jgi:magnesium-transporting ATPase (P-type)